MDFSEASKKIDDIEKELGELVSQHLQFSNVPQEKFVIVAIVNDCIDLLEESQRNIYAFSISYSHQENSIEFRPNYYYESIVMQYDMIWERIVLLIAILDGLDESVIFDKKSIEPLYDLIKKNHPEEDELGYLLRKVKGDFNNKLAKQNRNSNEHYISTHLKNDEKISDLSAFR